MLNTTIDFFTHFYAISGINFVEHLFVMMALAVVTFAMLIKYFEHSLPDSMKQGFLYGKLAFAGKQSKFIAKIEIPKSSFRHMYMFSSILMTFALVLVLYVYLFDNSVPIQLVDVFDLVGGEFRVATVSQSQVILALTLLTLQCYRRLYDTLFVSVFSKSKINLTHYFVGYIHYIGCALAILFEAPQFAPGSITNTNLKYLELFATVGFLMAFYQQYRTSVLLANLRKDAKGKIVSESHILPNGGLFQYLSSPHMTCEIVMYVCLTIILRNNVTWRAIFIWVISNQIVVILLNHWWYKENFKDFPATRKALIPFIY